MGRLVLAMLVVCLGPACGTPARTGAKPARPGERPGGAQATAWVRAVPSARLSAGGTGGSAGQQGTLLSAHWLAGNGSVTETDPEGKVVAWPSPLELHTPAPVRVWVDMPQMPSDVDIRLFDGAVDAAGAPLHHPRLVSCTEGRPGRTGCAYSSRDGGVDVEVPDPPSQPATRIVLYAEWYVPFAQRPAPAKSNATVSASWGFVLATSPTP